jgi:DcuC family C4-dicarboxylate transporter
VRLIGLDRVVHLVVEAIPGLLIPGAAFMPMAFGALSGSGMAAAQTLAAFFIEPAAAAGVSLLHVGGIVSIGAAAGRTMSPVAAVTLMCARMTECNPTDVARRVVVPLLVSTATVVLVGSLLAAGPWKREPLQQPAAPMASPQ